MKTIAEAKAEMVRRGQTVADWARKHEVSAVMVRKILSGTVKCNYGESHKIAVLLGIKDGVIEKADSHEHA